MSEVVKKEGSLIKQGGRHKSWKKRWFVLKNSTRDDDVLVYYSSDKKADEKGTIQLKGCGIRILPAQGKEQYCFEIFRKEGAMTAKHATYVMAAASQTEVNDWMSSVSHACKAASGQFVTFGQPIGDVVRKENVGKPIPVLVQMCIKYVDEKALSSEGIYRLSGSSSEVQHLKTLADRGELKDVSGVADVNVVSSLLKLFFREMAEPLLTYDRYQEFTSLATKANMEAGEKANEMRKLVGFLPAPNRATLQVLIEHLRRVASNASSNSMPIENLAAVFGPTLLKDRNESVLTMVTNTAAVCETIKVLYDLYDDVFNSSGESTNLTATPNAPPSMTAPAKSSEEAAAAAPPAAPEAAAPAPPPAAAPPAAPPAAAAGYPGGAGGAPAAPGYPGGAAAPTPGAAPSAYADVPSFYKKPVQAAPAPPADAPPAAGGASDARVAELEAKLAELESKLTEEKARADTEAAKATDLTEKLKAERQARNWLERTFEKELVVIRSQHAAKQ